MKRKLVILGSSLTALAVARDAHAQGVMPVVVDSEAGIAFKSRWVEPVLLPGSNTDEVMACVLQSAGARNALVATGDHWLRFVVARRAALDAAFGQILHPANPMLEICLSKNAFSVWCKANDLPSPRTWSPEVAERPAALKFPMLIRPRETLHSRPNLGLPKAVEVHTESELREWIDRFLGKGVAPLVSESLLAHSLTQYSVPFARRSNTMLSFVARKVRPGPEDCSEGTLVELTTNVEVERLGRLAAERAGYHGIGEVEILHLHDSGKSYLIEINARPWLQYALAPATGHDFLGLMLGTQNAAAPSVRRAEKTWVNLRGDSFVAFSKSNGLVRNRRLGFGAYIRSLARSNVYAVFDLRDPMPFVHTLRKWRTM
jgi:predicted ATP-grasp superfamily ATP-dependent carboligase